MRIIIVGSGSFIARAVTRELENLGHNPVLLRHDASLSGMLDAGDCLINFALTPGYRSGPYVEDEDCDRRAARAAAAAGAHFMMLSTRRVYAAESRWNAIEAKGAQGDATAYGRNKAITEHAVLEMCGDNAGVFRLSNVIGYEYGHVPQRHSFLGILLASLIQKNTIYFDMHPDTRRDFLPVEIAAAALAARAIEKTAGIYNLGAGFGLGCGELADWIRAGYGGGELVCDPMIVHDEFYLNMDKWRSQFDFVLDRRLLQNYCTTLGRRLKCEKSL